MRNSIRRAVAGVAARERDLLRSTRELRVVAAARSRSRTASGARVGRNAGTPAAIDLRAARPLDSQREIEVVRALRPGGPRRGTSPREICCATRTILG
jgi:hypothetical protein